MKPGKEKIRERKRKGRKAYKNEKIIQEKESKSVEARQGIYDVNKKEKRRKVKGNEEKGGIKRRI